MEKRPLGRTGYEATVLGFGAMEVRGPRIWGGRELSDVQAQRILNAVLDAGINLIDTAWDYGRSEEYIGRFISNRRDEYFLATKCGCTWVDRGEYDETPHVWTRENLTKNIDDSLRRMKTDHVDLLQLHNPSVEQVEQGDLVQVLKDIQASGKTRFIGYSGDHKAALYAIECGAFDSLQTSVNIADQECVTLTLPKAQAAGMGVIAKRPIANVAWKSGDQKPDNAYTHTYWERLRELDYDFLKGNDAVATALRFTLSQPGVCTAIVGTTKPERWQSNAKLLDAGMLPQAQMDAIRARWQEVSGPSWVGQG